MIIIAASLYLPEHIAIISRRVYFYWGGDESAYVKELVGVTDVAASTWTQGARAVDTQSVLGKLREL